MGKEIQLDRETFKALAGETRIQILKELNQRRKTQSELAAKLGVSPPTVNEHLELLKKAGLIHPIDEGRKWKYYALTEKGKELLNPGETRILVMLGVSSLLFVGTVFYLFSRFFGVLGSKAAQGVSQTALDAERSFSAPLLATSVPASSVAEATPWMAGFSLPELVGLAVLALLAGFLIGMAWHRLNLAR